MAQIWEPEWSEEIGQWTVSFSVKGQRIRKRLGVRSKSDKARARREAKRLHDEAWECHSAAPSQSEITKGRPFWEAAEAYVQEGGEARFLVPIMRHFGSTTTCEEIDAIVKAEVAVSLYPGRARSTIRRQVHVPIDAVLNFAAGKRKQETGDNPRTRWLTPEEAEELLGPPASRSKIAFLLGTGCRTGEMFAANAADFSLELRQFRVRGEVEGAGKTMAASRFIPIPAKTIELVGEIPSDGALFRTPKGVPYKMRAKGGGQMAAAFNRARDKAGLGSDITPHVLRHTWATWHYAQNKDVIRLMVEGGWSKADMVRRYTKLAPPDLPERLLHFGWDFRQKTGKSNMEDISANVYRGL